MCLSVVNQLVKVFTDIEEVALTVVSVFLIVKTGLDKRCLPFNSNHRNKAMLPDAIQLGPTVSMEEG